MMKKGSLSPKTRSGGDGKMIAREMREYKHCCKCGELNDRFRGIVCSKCKKRPVYVSRKELKGGTNGN